MKPRKAYLLRLDPQLFDALETWAGADLRSVNAQIEFILKQAVARRGKLLPDEEPKAGSKAEHGRGDEPQPTE